MFSTHMFFSYCEPDGKHINLSNPDVQYSLNRAGILCKWLQNELPTDYWVFPLH